MVCFYKLLWKEGPYYFFDHSVTRINLQCFILDCFLRGIRSWLRFQSLSCINSCIHFTVCKISWSAGLQKFSLSKFFIWKRVLKCSRDHLSTSCFRVCILWQIQRVPRLGGYVSVRQVHRKIRIARSCLYFIVVKDLTISKYKQERQNTNPHLKRVLVWFVWGFFSPWCLQV